MSLSGFIVRKFRSAALERAFRVDYAQRYAGQRRIAGAVSLLLWEWVLHAVVCIGYAFTWNLDRWFDRRFSSRTAAPEGGRAEAG